MKTEEASRWDNQIFYYSGLGFGLTDDLQTICLGKEADIKKFFETGEINEDLNPLQKQILRELKEEIDSGEPEPKKRNPVRSRPSRDFKRREAHIRQAALRKTIPVRPPRQKK